MRNSGKKVVTGVARKKCRPNRFIVTVTGSVTVTMNRVVTLVVLVVLGVGTFYQR